MECTCGTCFENGDVRFTREKRQPLIDSYGVVHNADEVQHTHFCYICGCKLDVDDTNEDTNVKEAQSTASEARIEVCDQSLIPNLSTSGGGNGGSQESVISGDAINTFTDLFSRYRPLLDRFLGRQPLNTTIRITELGEDNSEDSSGYKVTMPDLMSKYPDLFYPFLRRPFYANENGDQDEDQGRQKRDRDEEQGRQDEDRDEEQGRQDGDRDEEQGRQDEDRDEEQGRQDGDRDEEQGRRNGDRDEEEEQKRHEAHLSMATFVGSVVIPGSLSTSSFHPVGSRSRLEDVQFYCFIVCYLLAALLSLSATLVHFYTPTVTNASRRRLYWASYMTLASLFFMFVAFFLSLLSLDDTTQSIVVAAVSGVYLILSFIIFIQIKVRMPLRLA